MHFVFVIYGFFKLRKAIIAIILDISPPICFRLLLVLDSISFLCLFSPRMPPVTLQFDLHNMTKLVSRANQLKGYLKTAKTITDKMDVIFTSRIVERLGRLVVSYERVSVQGEGHLDHSSVT